MNIEVEWLQGYLGPLEARHFLALSFLGHGCAGLPRKKSEGSHLWRRRSRVPELHARPGLQESDAKEAAVPHEVKVSESC